ncbi:hypothetical protein BKA93DRAFT_147764 [Sparassis latifolia]
MWLQNDSWLYLTGITIQFPDGVQPELPDNAQLYLSVLVNGDEIKKTGYCMKTAVSSWKLTGAIKLSSEALNCMLVVSFKVPDDESMQLGFMELSGDELLAKALDEGQPFAKAFTMLEDGPHCAISASCFIVPPDGSHFLAEITGQGMYMCLLDTDNVLMLLQSLKI